MGGDEEEDDATGAGTDQLPPPELLGPAPPALAGAVLSPAALQPPVEVGEPKPKPKPKPKRTRYDQLRPYMLFSQSERPKIVAKCPTLTHNEVLKALGLAWVGRRTLIHSETRVESVWL